MGKKEEIVMLIKRKVLVVEDDLGLLRLILKFLGKDGYVVYGVSTGKEAIESMTKDRDQVLLIDQQLPDMTGRDVISHLADKRIYIPFVMMTGQGDERLAVEMMKLGALDYLVKDIDFINLLPGVLERVFRSIETERKLKEAEEALRQRELQLRISEARLLELNHTKDRFFSIISHDLKGFFSGIIGFAELMVLKTEHKDYERVSDYSVRLYDSAKKGFALLENLLQWARLQTGKLEFQPNKLPLHPLAKDVEDLYNLNFRKRGIEFSIECPEELEVYMDEFMVETVLRNLVTNAIKFTPAGGKISLKAQKNNSEVTVSLSDTGIGISKDDIAKLFRIDVNHSTVGVGEEKGTGLGLILCKEFIDKHGGKIWVESQVDRGSTFFFTLPTSKSKGKSLSSLTNTNSMKT